MIKNVVFDLESIVCSFCDADSSNCFYCNAKEEIIKVLQENGIEAKEN